MKHKDFRGISESAWSTLYVDVDGKIDVEFDNYFNRAVDEIFKGKKLTT